MEQEKQLTEQESLQLIASMINRAKSDYIETGISALMWGIVVMFCSFISFANHWWQIGWIDTYIWSLTFFAVLPQVIISIRESRQKKFTAHNDDAMGGIWISFGVTMFLLAVYSSKFQVNHQETLYLIIYGVPTFSTGVARHFKPMIWGGIACWLLALLSIHFNYPYTMLLMAAAALLAWFIPGLILRRRYRKLKEEHV